MRLRIVPAILIVLGVTLLLGNLEIVPREAIRHFVHVWWPLLLVGLGGTMLLMPRGACRHHHCGPRRDEPPAAGPA